MPQAPDSSAVRPYRWLRHPLYLSEEIAALGVLLQHMTLGAVLIVVAHIAVQIGRIRFEEQLLGQAFLNIAFSQQKWRVMPHVYRSKDLTIPIIST